MTQQLRPQDAVFLALETEELPCHIGGLAFLKPNAEGDFSFERFVAIMRERLGAIERFSSQLQEVPYGFDRPYWVHRKNFDPAMLIHQVALPAPYSHEALSKLVGILFERPLDRDQPLWEMDLIEGLPGGQHVLLWKMHHCMIDGTSGVNLSEYLFDRSSDTTGFEPVTELDSATTGDRISTVAVVERALRNAAALPATQRRFARQALTGVVRTLRTKARTRETRPATAPRTHFNGSVGRRRGLAWSSVSLDEIKRVKKTMSVTVNDVVLALTSGAMRGYLADRQELPESSLIVSVPVSTREMGDTSLGNQIREITIGWSTDIEDPVERLLEIHENSSEAKRRAQDGDSIDWMGIMSEALLPTTLQTLVRGVARISDKIPLPGNTVVSNIPMAPTPLYCGGARITQVVPISMLAPSQGINITVLSYCGELHFGIVHDPDLLPDAWDFAGRIPKSLLALQEAVERWRDRGARENQDDRFQRLPSS